jgi:hypothetical protein
MKCGKGFGTEHGMSAVWFFAWFSINELKTLPQCPVSMHRDLWSGSQYQTIYMMMWNGHW